MATSKTGGAFGFLQKSIGSVTYATQKDRNGKRVQVARQKITEMTNPETIGQILQRMKLKPAQRFYAAVNEADGARILEHSWEGLKYGSAGLREFMSRAMKADGPFIPKNADKMIPAEYQISAGSMTKCPISVNGSNGFALLGAIHSSSNDNGQKLLDTIEYFYGTPDVQLTFVLVNQRTDGEFEVSVCRIIPRLGIDGNNNDIITLNFNVVDNKLCVGINYEAVGVIASLQSPSGTWKRSDATMVLVPTLRDSIYGDAAREEAIASYRSGGESNALNSQWYLNLANKQPWPGQILVYNNPDFPELNGVVYGQQVNNFGDLVNTIFTVTGASSSNVLVSDGSTVSPSSTVTGEDAQETIGGTYAVWEVNYATQIGQTYESGGSDDPDDDRP